MRLIDQIRAAGRIAMPMWVAPERVDDWAAYAQKILAVVMDEESLPVIRCDNVADYYYHGTDQEYWDLTRDFPNLAPPYDHFWTEHKLVTRIESKECGTTDLSSMLGRGGTVGALWIVATPDQCRFEGTPPEGLRWVVWADLLIDYGQGYVQGPHGAILLLIDGDGRLLGTPQLYTFAADKDAEIMKGLVTWLHPSLLAISFLHCRNVVVQDEQVPKPLAKKYHARTGHWPVKYKTLVIEPMKQVLRQEGRHGAGNNLAQALHICRGHFKDYREGRGLFGKYHQLVWQPAIVRGTRRHKDEAAPPRDMEVRAPR